MLYKNKTYFYITLILISIGSETLDLRRQRLKTLLLLLMPVYFLLFFSLILTNKLHLQNTEYSATINILLFINLFGQTRLLHSSTNFSLYTLSK